MLAVVPWSEWREPFIIEFPGSKMTNIKTNCMLLNAHNIITRLSAALHPCSLSACSFEDDYDVMSDYTVQHLAPMSSVQMT